MSAQPRRFHLRRIAIATAIALPVAAWAASLGGGFILGAGPRGEGCRFFWGESVDSLAWSPAGAYLLVSTRSSEDAEGGVSAIRVFEWPGMQLSAIRGQSSPPRSHPCSSRRAAGRQGRL
jgi:hypothetical protein